MSPLIVQQRLVVTPLPVHQELVGTPAALENLTDQLVHQNLVGLNNKSNEMWLKESVIVRLGTYISH